MAKGKMGGESRKITFGKRKGGKAAKSRGPKDKKVSKYVAQGR
jgi:hypothetical protein